MNTVTPRSIDVLCGSGGEALKHPGNKRFRDIVGKHCALYSTMTRRTKMERMKVTKHIFDEVTQAGARFLRKDPVLAKTWYLVGSHKVARDKISHYLRRLEKDGQHPSIARGDDVSNQRRREQDSSRTLSHNTDVDLLDLVRKASGILRGACSTDTHCTTSTHQEFSGSLVGAWQHQVDGLFAPISTQHHASLQTVNSSPTNSSSGTSITHEARQQDYQGAHHHHHHVTPDKGLSAITTQVVPPLRMLAPAVALFVPTGHYTNSFNQTNLEPSGPWATRETSTTPPPSISPLCSRCILCNHAGGPLQQAPALTCSSHLSIGGNDCNSGVDATSTMTSFVASREVCNHDPPTLSSSRTSSVTDEQVDHELNQLIDSFLFPKEHGGQDGNLWEAFLGHQCTIDLDAKGGYEPIATFQ